MEMITSLDFPERRDLSTVLYPRVYLPDLSCWRSEWEVRGQHARSRATFERRCGRRARSPETTRRRKKRHASAPHDNLEAVVDAVVLLALLLGLGRLGGGSGGGGVSAHRRWVLYSLLKRVKRRCCCTKRALRTECGCKRDGVAGARGFSAFREPEKSDGASRIASRRLSPRRNPVSRRKFPMSARVLETSHRSNQNQL